MKIHDNIDSILRALDSGPKSVDELLGEIKGMTESTLCYTLRLLVPKHVTLDGGKYYRNIQ